MDKNKPDDTHSHLTRRELLLATAGVAALHTAATASAADAATASATATTPPSTAAAASPSAVTGAPVAPAVVGPFSLPALPFADAALDPVISANTLGFHYGKHHRAYVDNLNKAVAGTPYADMALDKIIAATYGVADKSAVYNNASQHWNHSFYWRSLRPQGGGEPPAALRLKLETSFGSVDACRKELLTAATTEFGSGWAWLVQDGGRLAVVKTGNADSPASKGQRPLLTIDVWEHAYYLDYQNKRADYVAGVIGKLLNWGFAADNLGVA
jgi:Fe-Mn family superoxide dismutase